MAIVRFGTPETKKSKKDGHTYASSQILVNNVPVGYVVKHSEVLYGVALPNPEGKGLVWTQFPGRDGALAHVRKNAEKALGFKTAQDPAATAQLAFGL